MSVPTAHKILISSAIGFFAFYALWELARFRSSGETPALAWSAAATLGALGLALYLRRYIRSLGPS